jgi:hypothetical protein
LMGGLNWLRLPRVPKVVVWAIAEALKPKPRASRAAVVALSVKGVRARGAGQEDFMRNLGRWRWRDATI